VDERELDGRLVDGRELDRRVVDGRQLDERLLDGCELDRRLLDERVVDGRLLDGRVVDELSRQSVTPPARMLPLPFTARLYYLAVAAAALAAGGLAFTRLSAATHHWFSFAVLASAAAAAQVFIVRTGRSHGFHTAIVFVVAGALLLPPELIVLMAVVQHLPEWVKERYPWFIQTFNIANFALSSLAAWAVAASLAPTDFGGADARAALAAIAAGVVFVCLNHVLLATMLRLGRDVSFAESGLFSFESLAVDVVLAGLGIAFAIVWLTNVWLVPAVIAPLALSQRSLRLLGRARDSEERFRTMFEAAPIGMIVRDLDGRLLSTNPAFERMVGYTTAELEHVDPSAGAVAGSVATGDGYGQEQRFVAKDGREVVGLVDVAVVRDAGRRPQFVLSMVQDITQHKLLEDELRQAQKMEAIGRLAGGVAHDFNNLLTAISGYANLVLDRLRERNSDLAEDVSEIDKAAQRAHSLTRQLLAFSRKQLLKPQILKLNDVVGDMDTMLRRLIGEDIEIVTVYGSGLARVRADPGQLQQVIVNLVVNARDEMPVGGTLSIETANATIAPADAARRDSEVQAGTFVTLTIRDTGRGMDEETKTRLFEPFFTRKAIGKGTGLGLATVYGIVKQSGGFIEVESEPGEGAAFTIFLPALLTAVEENDCDESPPEPTPGGVETVLLVEDEDLVRRYVATVLTNAGYRVLVARDGHEAVRMSKDEEFDLLLTDVVMPRISGPELAKRLRLPVLFMSGYTGELIAQHELLEPGMAYIQKPFSAADLKRSVRAAIDDARDAPRNSLSLVG
jgi:PAS domain S-box-containing protein